MSFSDVMSLLGSTAPWVAGVIAIFLATFFVLAFRQGRQITMWPPAIGPRQTFPPDDPPPTERRAPSREYGVDRAREFYERIARSYDLRNSGNLVSTHLATIAQLQAIHREKPTMRVLDLGGGTGKLIALYFFNDPEVSWTYVDFSPAMTAELRRNLAGYPLGRHMEIIQDDLNDAVRERPDASYDVVMLSLVLSSMPQLPDFQEIARVLAPGGTLLVTDISPSYTHLKPLYRVSVNGEEHALRTTPVDPYEVIRRARKVGLRVTINLPLGDGTTYYSFLTAFSNDVTATGPASLAA